MSIHRNSNKNPNKAFGKIILAVIVAFVFLNAVKQNNRQKHRSPGTPAVSQPQAVANPILGQLQQNVQTTPRAGIAIGIALDVSGSMDEVVADQDGGSQPKIVIARRCVLNILKETEAFLKKHPDQPIEVGVYEFSSRSGQPSCRQVIPFGPVRLDPSGRAVDRMRAKGGTPIGDAIVTVKQKMNLTGLKQQHLLVITDGENNQGYDPGDVVNAIYRLPDDQIANVYFFAFDVAANKFNKVRDAGGLVLAATNEQGLQQTLDYVLAGKILVEQPEIPGAK
jgi:hypothetical protein